LEYSKSLLTCFWLQNLAKHDYTVLKAISPHYSFTYLMRNKEEGWKSLGGILLAFTGMWKMLVLHQDLDAVVGLFGPRLLLDF
jgi:K+ transporter